MNMDAYDEDLTENLWYQTLCQKYEDLFLRATNERWMICIPQCDSWKKSLDGDQSVFSQNSFESHIIKPTLVYSSDKSAAASSKENNFITFNGKELIIQGTKIFCSTGFSYNFNKPSYDKRYENLALNVETCHTSQILFEETFFNQNDESYVVVCISHPLEPELAQQKNVGTEVEESKSTEHAGETFGTYLWEHASHSARLRQQIDEKIAQFVIYPRKVDENYNEIYAEHQVKSIAETLLNFLTVCLHIVLRDSKLKKLSEIPSQKEALKNAIEGYVLHGTSRAVTLELDNLLAPQDCALNKITRNLSSVTLNDLGVEDQFWSTIPRARRELNQLNRHRTPKKKLSCLQNAIASLSSKPKDKPPVIDDNPSTPIEDKTIGPDAVAMQNRPQETAALSTDDLLPILIYLVIKCDIANWLSNLAYLKYFSFTNNTQDKSWFHIATLEAALEHVKQENIHAVKVKSFRKQTSCEEFSHFFTALENGEVDDVQRMLRQAEAMRSLQEHDKCHPLCECNKCQKLTDLKLRDGNHRDISVSSRDDKGRTPLHVAAVTGKHELVEALLKLGADFNASDYHGSSPLHLAAQDGNQSVIFILLHYGSNPNAEDNNKNTPLHLACLGGHESCVKAMLFYDPVTTVANVNAKNDAGDTPLHIASKWGYVSIVQALVEYGADPHQTNKWKVNPFNVSHDTRVSRALRNTEMDNPRIVQGTKTLSTQRSVTTSQQKSISKRSTGKSIIKTKPNPITEEERAAKQVEKLLRAVGDNDVNMVSYVCGWDTKPEILEDKCHPLCQCLKCQPPSQDVCLHANSSNQKGTTPLLIASKRGFVDMVNLLLAHGAKVNVKDKQGYSALHFAAQYGHEKIMKLLLEQGAMSDIRDVDGNTPIYMCAMNGHIKCVQLLLENRASVNLRNHHGDSPLHEAVRWKRSDAACLLIESGALGYYRNVKGMTVLDLAKEDAELHECLSKAFSAHDIFDFQEAIQSEEPHSSCDQSSNETLRKSFSRLEADELIAENLLKQFHGTNVPSTPPMLEGNILDEGSKFNFDLNVAELPSSTIEEKVKVNSSSTLRLKRDDTTKTAAERGDGTNASTNPLFSSSKNSNPFPHFSANHQQGQSTLSTNTNSAVVLTALTERKDESNLVASSSLGRSIYSKVVTETLTKCECTEKAATSRPLSDGSYFEIIPKTATESDTEVSSLQTVSASAVAFNQPTQDPQKKSGSDYLSLNKNSLGS